MSVFDDLTEMNFKLVQSIALLESLLQHTERTEPRADSAQNEKELRDLIDGEVVPHFEIEDKVVFPILERLPGMDRQLIAGLIEEHKRILSKVEELWSIRSRHIDVVSAARAALLKDQIVRDIRAHASKENDKLLPMSRRLATVEQATQLRKILEEERKTEQT